MSCEICHCLYHHVLRVGIAKLFFPALHGNEVFEQIFQPPTRIQMVSISIFPSLYHPNLEFLILTGAGIFFPGFVMFHSCVLQKHSCIRHTASRHLPMYSFFLMFFLFQLQCIMCYLQLFFLTLFSSWWNMRLDLLRMSMKSSFNSWFTTLIIILMWLHWMQDQGMGRNMQDDSWEKVNQIRDKFEYDREKRMRERGRFS